MPQKLRRKFRRKEAFGRAKACGFMENRSGRTLSDIFKRYRPTGELGEILHAASECRVFTDRENKIVKATAHFPRLIPKKKLYAFEEEIREAYDVREVRLFPAV